MGASNSSLTPLLSRLKSDTIEIQNEAFWEQLWPETLLGVSQVWVAAPCAVEGGPLLTGV